MQFGYTGNIVKVSLSTGEVDVKQKSDVFYRTFLGGTGLAAYFLFREVEPGVDALSAENKLVFASSVVMGVPVPSVVKFTVAAKSPLTGSFGASQAGGFWGPELKFAGFDAVIVEGEASEPVYLWIHNEDVEIRDASHLWGSTTLGTQNSIREELGDPLVRVATIGKGGENQVRFASIISDLKYANGRGGMGAVMGAKKLKAIAVRGEKKIQVYDPDALRRIRGWFRDSWRKNPGTMNRSRYGTSDGLLSLNEDGILPTRNFREGRFDEAEEISGERMKERILLSQEGCYACPVRCKRVVKGLHPFVSDPVYGGPEYETLAAFGSNCGVSNISAIAKAHELCNMHSLDTISAGSAISFAMECYEKGILKKDQISGLSLKFGNAKEMIKLLEMIARREGLGDFLAEGVKRAADKIGGDEFAFNVKGKEVPMHEPRGKTGVGLAYALSSIGADHMQAAHDPIFSSHTQLFDRARSLGILKPVDRSSLGAEKVKLFVYLQYWWSALNCLGFCLFSAVPHQASMYDTHHIVEIVNATTGWNLSLWELMKAGERALNLARCFNIRDGFTKKDDWLPERFFRPLGSGSRKGAKISKPEFRKAIDLYYQMMGWNKNTGIPSRAKLEELNIGWIADSLR